MQARGATRVDELVEVPGPARTRALLFGDDAHGVHGVVQLVGVRDFRPRLFANRGDGRGIELADVGRAFRVEPAALRDRERAPLFERRIVQIGVGPRVENFRGQRRRLDQILAR